MVCLILAVVASVVTCQKLPSASRALVIVRGSHLLLDEVKGSAEDFLCSTMQTLGRVRRAFRSSVNCPQIRCGVRRSSGRLCSPTTRRLGLSCQVRICLDKRHTRLHAIQPACRGCAPTSPSLSSVAQCAFGCCTHLQSDTPKDHTRILHAQSSRL